MLPAEAAAISMRDCGASLANQNQVLVFAAAARRRGTGASDRDQRFSCAILLTIRSIVRGYGAAAFQTLLQNVVEFKVFYRFDDVAYAAGASGVTNAVPFGGSIRDAAAINALGRSDRPLELRRRRDGVLDGSNRRNRRQYQPRPTPRRPRCPITAAEAETGLGLVTTTTDGRHPPHVFAGVHRAQPCHSVSFNTLAMNKPVNRALLNRRMAPARRMMGVVLPVVLVVLTVLTGLVVTQIRRSAVDERLAANTRESVQLDNSVQTVLRWCEARITLAPQTDGHGDAGTRRHSRRHGRELPPTGRSRPISLDFVGGAALLPGLNADPSCVIEDATCELAPPISPTGQVGAQRLPGQRRARSALAQVSYYRARFDALRPT